VSYDIVQEDVPGFIRRIGDKTIAGSNNALIWLGTDRADSGPADIDTGLGTLESSGGGKGTGTIMAVVGRNDPAGNPDLSADMAYLYLTMKSKIDDNLGLGSVETSTSGDGESGAIMKSDNLRFVFRKNIKISLDGGSNYVYVDGSTAKVVVGGSKLTITDGKVVIDVGAGGEIDLGGNPTDSVVLGDKLLSFLSNHISSEYAVHTHPTSQGPSGPPLVPPAPPDSTLLSNISKVQ